MRVLASCVDNGSLKEVVFGFGTDTSVQTAPQPQLIETHLCEGLDAHVEQIHKIDDGKWLLARHNGTVQYVESELVDHSEIEGMKVSHFDVVGSITGLLDVSRLDHLNAQSKRRTKLKDGFVSLAPVSKKDCYLACTKSGLVHILALDFKDKLLTKLQTFEVKAPLEFAQVYDIEKTKKTVFACGGEENLVKLFELSESCDKISMIWESKNVKNDRLDMRVPVWPVALKFLQPVPTSSAGYDKNKLNFQFLVVTGWSHFGIYNTQHGKRPMKYLDLLPEREPLRQLELLDPSHNTKAITQLGNLKCKETESLEFITTDKKTQVLKYNGQGQLIGKYGKGDITGLATYIGIHDQKYLLEGGLDRYLRVFDIESRAQKAKIYLGTNINRILVLDEELEALQEIEMAKNNKRKQTASDEEDDAEELWSKLETKKEKKRKL
ncbi:Ribosome biogenesis protein NSA1 [Nakaseomyces glabratus]|nr:hypothetical protein J6894_01543 [Nakaseomyces glabratus]QNG13627.1 uncharacterized protein GWK60_F06941 [Nakaseomyces glabratus]SCV17449.1 Ribosome biogenesis protein NSA1 [Nakaseomyces glabratus]SLM17238.1 Ribosome biogenesis protein NSA1 [Nakaseomyces glabratus]